VKGPDGDGIGRGAEPVHIADPAVTVSELGHSFEPARGKQVLKNVCLNVAAGEFIVLMGPSGAGKTTLLTLIGALRRAQSGEIRLHGRPLSGLSNLDLQNVRRDIGFIFQNHNLFEALTSCQTLRLAMRLFPDRYSRAEIAERPGRMLGELDMAACLHSRPAEMSTGQKQRVAVARALINDPRLILADEPTASLDRDAAAMVMALLKRHTRERGTAVVMVTHDPRIFDTADRVVEMVDGCLV